MTRAGLVVAGSEAGLVDLDPEEVIHSGRLGPGQMLVVDLVGHNVYEDESLLELFDAGATYATLVEDAPLIPLATSDVDRVALAAVQRGFGYTREDVKMI
jgi:glutamate synthase (NADPH/NADH) large chain